MFLLNSRRGHFTAARVEPGHPFSLGYGAIVPSSLTRLLSRSLASSRHPTCVGLRYGRQAMAARLFSSAEPDAARGKVSLPPRPAPPGASTAYSGRPPASAFRHLAPEPCRRGNVGPLPIGYASRPGLRDRLTPGGRTCPGKPWDSGGRDFHPPFRYSCPHNRSPAVHGRSRSRFSPAGDAPLPLRAERAIRGVGTALTPDHCRRRITRPVSCYALFKRWLPLSQRPGCLGNPTSFVTERRLGAFAGGLGCFPLGDGTYLPPPISRPSGAEFGVCQASVPLRGPSARQCSTSASRRFPGLTLKLFRGEPAITRLD